MSIAFVHFGCILSFHTASAIVLSVCNMVGDCSCTISSNTILMYTALHAMLYIAASSADVADLMTCLIIWEMLRIALLNCGIVASLDKKK